jgi:mannose-1-phosphate guanylyltransferase / mannose-6-phosphate isomerase
MHSTLNMKIIPVLLAGGSGERLWPLSKLDYPKQFVSLDASGHSLFQETLKRVSDRNMFAAPVIVCNQEHRFIVSEQLRQLRLADATIILEPAIRNTAPSMLLAALHCQHIQNSAMLVLPSDQIISDADSFIAAIKKAAPVAQDNFIVTFGIAPNSPETGYGYIKAGEAIDGHSDILKIAHFAEKPSKPVAESYLKDKSYVWNSGIFLMKATVAIEEMKQHDQAMLDVCHNSYESRRESVSFVWPNKEIFMECPSNSIDYALMEKTNKGAVIAVSMQWQDLGAWPALYDISTKDDLGNAVSGRAILVDAHNCYIRSEKMLIAALGINDLVIVENDNAVLVGPKDRMQDIKQLFKPMRDQNLPDSMLTSFSHRPWGNFYKIDSGAHYQVKKLSVKPGSSISLQSHAMRAEHWVVVKGRATVTKDGNIFALEENQSAYIPPGTIHRLENKEKDELIVIEVQTGKHLSESDITRFEDVYDRE